MPKSLSDIMELDHVIRVMPDGTVRDADSGCYAPELYCDDQGNNELSDDRWQLMSGYTGQYGYDGPIMHASEFIGGQLERDILATPGLYVAIVCYSDNEDGETDDVAGWAVAYVKDEV